MKEIFLIRLFEENIFQTCSVLKNIGYLTLKNSN